MFRRYHRYIGLIVVLFVILLSGTGILLNHTKELQLAKRYVQLEGILNWYGIQPPNIDTAFLLKENETTFSWISAINNQLYLDKKLLSGYYIDVKGAVILNSLMMVVLTDKNLVLLTLEGELIERLTPVQGLPIDIIKLGLNNQQQLQVQTPKGIYQPDNNFINWKQQLNVQLNEIKWITPQYPPKTLQHTLITKTRSQILSWERVLLDLHSGRLFGTLGIYFIDVAAILFLILAFTGIAIWLRHFTRKLYNNTSDNFNNRKSK